MTPSDFAGQRSWFVGDEKDRPAPAPTDTDRNAVSEHDADVNSQDVSSVTHDLSSPVSSDFSDDNASYTDDEPDENIFGARSAASLAEEHASDADESTDSTEDFAHADSSEADMSDNSSEHVTSDEENSIDLSNSETFDDSQDDTETTLVHRQSVLNQATNAHDKSSEASSDDEIPAEIAGKPGSFSSDSSVADVDVDEQDDSVSWERPKSQQRDLEEAIFDGATVLPAVPSRAPAHLWSLVLSILLIPTTWYLVWDAASRLTLPEDAQWSSGVIDTLAVSELAGGCVALFVTILLARWSSLASFIWGLVFSACGVVFIAVPGLARQYTDSVLDNFARYNDFTSNVAHHFVWSASSGFFVMLGVGLLALGFVSHGARRKGRRDFQTQRKVERSKHIIDRENA